MVTAIVVLTLLCIGFASFAAFLAKEMFKKFGFMAEFLKSSRLMVGWHHKGGSPVGMHNIVLRSTIEEPYPFTVLVGFKMILPVLGQIGYDYYGFAESDDNGVVVIRTYLGTDACDFIFVANCDVDVRPIVATSTRADQDLTPHAVFPPHTLLHVLPDTVRAWIRRSNKKE